MMKATWGSYARLERIGTKLVADELVSWAPSHDSCCIECKRRAALGIPSVRYLARTFGYAFLQLLRNIRFSFALLSQRGVVPLLLFRYLAICRSRTASGYGPAPSFII